MYLEQRKTDVSEKEKNTCFCKRKGHMSQQKRRTGVSEKEKDRCLCKREGQVSLQKRNTGVSVKEKNRCLSTYMNMLEYRLAPYV